MRVDSCGYMSCEKGTRMGNGFYERTREVSRGIGSLGGWMGIFIVLIATQHSYTYKHIT